MFEGMSSVPRSLDEIRKLRFTPPVSAVDRDEFIYLGWKYKTIKANMLPSVHMGEWAKPLGSGVGLPDAIFGENALVIDHPATGFRLSITPLDALRGTILSSDGPCFPPQKEYKRWIPQVAHARSWQAAARATADKWAAVHDASPVSDWTYSSSYWGSAGVSFSSSSSSLGETQVEVEREEKTEEQTEDGQKKKVKVPILVSEETSEEIPMELLTRRDPIVWSKQLPLFEDDLSDCGVSKSDVKIRVMPKFWFVLIRQEVRVDRVMVRQIDTRIFHLKGSRHVIREFLWREATFDELRNRGIDLSPGKLHIHMNENLTGAQLLSSPEDDKWKVRESLRLPEFIQAQVPKAPPLLPGKAHVGGDQKSAAAPVAGQGTGTFGTPPTKPKTMEGSSDEQTKGVLPKMGMLPSTGEEIREGEVGGTRSSTPSQGSLRKGKEGETETESGKAVAQTQMPSC
uniref:TIP41-like protein n=1 Tax=Chromera velia CCMP2878 TaxID=1169474 RepID=A0A0G4HFW3_9ALVE|eukprot:Cvel_27203.t1-p1 / transcript=Cvel_27203.t1 / gene=Cvel_27203 / organism=Chromera_velia_CCMP2878 / gene_product=TIP41-like protein, putative / transcript_product=TIP41-like protein, putative / location=Cvel_scaffold3359:1096-6892(+) / protein_length=455 / sequence_SO=supercontig / SO=protein_coding / is_pseudo=false